jgi:1-aminocyclopropane-1-carboxylate deaminase/D-cysteine desulfhydrase-like pyridoxal-dependent ACC family enzyme
LALADFPREQLLFGPSPVHRLERLSEHLGGSVEIWATRDDWNSGLAFGGNKKRKLEYLAADALALGCDTLVSAALIDLVRDGRIAPGSRVLYAHLGGQPALSAYAGALS